ncbi:MAG: sugar phosphate isomerase/epimerase [Rubripirellula sp.]|nr:sugar phosphate isomerase/epimerase [Rubripirellula sp.]
MDFQLIPRRNALTVLGSAVAAASLPGRHLVAADLESNTNAACRLGFSTYGLPGYSPRQAVEAIAKAGFDGLELTVTPERDVAAERMNASQRDEFQTMLDDHGLELCSLMANYRPLGSIAAHRRDLERLKRDIELAQDLSSGKPPIIQTVLGEKNWQEVKERAVERFADWLQISKDSGVVVAVKPHRGHAMSRPDEAAWLIKQLGNPSSIQMWFDFSHFLFREMPLKDLISDALPITAGIAVKDARQDGRAVRFELPGEAGTINYQELCQRFYAGGFRGSICVEVSSQVWKRPDYDPEKALVSSYQVLSTAMKQAGVPRPGR